MRFMNEWDIERAVQSYDPARTPNRHYLALVVSALRDWTNRNSDGWAYWPKPVRAARRLIETIDPYTNPEIERFHREDATDAEVKAALAPIKAFLTREGVRHDTVIPARQTAVTW